MNLDRLSLGEKLFGVSGLALFVLSFFPLWAKLELESEFIDDTARFTAWEGYGPLVDLALVLAIVGAGLVIAKASGANLTLPWKTVYLVIGGVVAALLVLAFLVGPDESANVSGPGGSIEVSRGLALFVGALLALGMAAGAWLHSEPVETSPGTIPA